MDLNFSHLVKKWLRVQSLSVFIVTGALLLWRPIAAYSALFGGMAVYLPSLLFGSLLAKKAGNNSAVFLRMAVVAEVSKLVLTAVLCAVVFLWVKPLEPAFFFLGMMITLLAGWLGLILVK